MYTEKMEVVKGDITAQEVDAIVNAAHEGLCGGGGVDGAIHRAAGSAMTGECMNLYGCPIGEARMTGGYNLPAKYIIHTVGPTWRGGKYYEEHDLKSCYRECLKFANMQGLKSIAFPCISTGAFCFPKEIAIDVALNTVSEFFVSKAIAGEPLSIQLVRFVCFDEEDYQMYVKRLS